MAETPPGRVPVPASGRPSKLARGGAVFGVLFSLFYLLNPGLGALELLPDVLPVVGNLDEVGFTGLMLYCLRVLGVDLIPRGGAASKGS